MSSKPRKYDQCDEIRHFLQTLALFRRLKDLDPLKLEASAQTVLLSTGESRCLDSDSEALLYIVVSGSIHIGEPVAKFPKPLVSGNLFTTEALRFSLQATTVRAAEASQLIGLPISMFDSVPTARQAIQDEITQHMLRIQIAAADIFSQLDESVLSYMSAHSEFVEVRRGEVIIREGDKTDCVYIIASGDLEVFKGQAEGARRTIDILHKGATVGEMAVLLNEPRSASVRAWRNSLLIKVPVLCIENVLRQNADVTFRLARTLGERLKRTTNVATRKVPVKTIALIPWCNPSGFSVFCNRLKLAFERSGARAVLLEPDDVSGRTGTLLPSEWIQAREAMHDYVLLQCPRESQQWTEGVIQHADMALFVCAPAESRPGDPGEAPFEIARTHDVRIELALVSYSEAAPQGSASWLGMAGFSAHHHVVIDRNADYERLARRVSGTALGLVLSGGGARGLAHIGVIRAIRDKGLPIDMIGGTSMGAIIAAQYATGYDPKQMLAITREAYLGYSQPRDFTLPFVSFRTGRATNQRLIRMFGARLIEDLPIGYFCVSSNLSRAEVVVHDSGPVWIGTRVSCSIPGILPPVPVQGDVLADGGFLDNLPVDAMRKRLTGPVIAADVSVEVDLPVPRELASETSWSGISQLFRTLRHRPRLPNIVDMLMRTVEVGSVRDSKIGGSPADLYLKVPVGNTSMTKFAEIDRLVTIGYEYASQKLEHWRPQNGDLHRGP